MRAVTRIHEWLADHCQWIQYPEPDFRRNRRMPLTSKQKAWLGFAIFWLAIIALSVYGNLLD